MNKYENIIGKILDGRYKILEPVGVGGEGVQSGNFGGHLEVVAENLDLLFAVLEAAAEGVDGLVSDEDDAVGRVVDAVLEVVQDAAVFAHPRRRQHDGGLLRGRDGLGIAHALREAQPARRDGRVAGALAQLEVLVVEDVLQVDHELLQVVVFSLHGIDLETGQLLEPEVQDRFGLIDVYRQ